jgi:LysM repeat protein
MVVAAFFVVFSAGVDADSTPRETVLHVVQPGDTLWNLASRYTPAGGDVRVTVGQIRDVNGLSHSAVEVGSAIHIPVP